MENISEKPKRGRPVKYEPERLALFAKIYPRHSRRGLIEIAFAASAAVKVKTAAERDPQANIWIRYFISDPTVERIFHKTVLAALGRIEPEEVLLVAAKYIATRRLRTAEAVEKIRYVRYRLECAEAAAAEADAEAPPEVGKKENLKIVAEGT